MESNWTCLGPIRAILPNAKIVDARRHPMASGFAALKHLFVDRVQYSYDLTELGRCCNDYTNTMAHFDAVMPGPVHRLEYENLVTDTETEISRVLAYCGLNFEPACLRFWETKRNAERRPGAPTQRPVEKL